MSSGHGSARVQSITSSLEKVLWSLSIEAEEESLGETDRGGYYALMRGPVSNRELKRHCKEEGLYLRGEDRAILRDMAGAIVKEDNYGFHDCETFSTIQELDERWAALCSQYSEDFPPEEEESTSGIDFIAEEGEPVTYSWYCDICKTEGKKPQETQEKAEALKKRHIREQHKEA